MTRATLNKPSRTLNGILSKTFRKTLLRKRRREVSELLRRLQDAERDAEAAQVRRAAPSADFLELQTLGIFLICIAGEPAPAEKLLSM